MDQSCAPAEGSLRGPAQVLPPGPRGLPAALSRDSCLSDPQAPHTSGAVLCPLCPVLGPVFEFLRLLGLGIKTQIRHSPCLQGAHGMVEKLVK